jgi:hypothetical protein
MEVDEIIESMIDELDEWDNINPSIVAAVEHNVMPKHVSLGEYLNNVGAVQAIIKAYLENQLKS